MSSTVHKKTFEMIMNHRKTNCANIKTFLLIEAIDFENHLKV